MTAYIHAAMIDFST